MITKESIGIFLTGRYNSFRRTLIRFPMSSLLSFLFCIALSAVAFFDMGRFITDFLDHSAYSLGLSTLLLLLFYLVREQFFLKIPKYVSYFLTVIVLPLFFWAKISDGSEQFYRQYAGFVVVTCFIIIFLLTRLQKDGFSRIIITGLFSILSSTLVFAALALCLVAIDELIFAIEKLGYVIGTAATFSYSVVGFNIFLNQIKNIESENQLPFAKAFEFIIGKLLFPLYLVLLTILSVYFIKILIVQKLPSGQLNGFVSWATALYLFFYFALKTHKNAFVTFFYSVIHYIILLCIAMQLWAVYIRVSAYGLTAPRLLGIYYTVSVLIFIIVVSIIKKLAYQTYFLLLAIVSFVASIGMFNVVDVSVKNQIVRLEKILIQEGMLVKNKERGQIFIDKTKSPSFENKIAITSAFEQIQNSPLSPSYIQSSIELSFGFKPEYSWSKDESDYLNFRYSVSQDVKIPLKKYQNLVYNPRYVYEDNDTDLSNFIVAMQSAGVRYVVPIDMNAIPNNESPFIISINGAYDFAILFLDARYNKTTNKLALYELKGILLEK